MSRTLDLMSRPVASDRFLVFHIEANGRLTSGRLTWDKLVAAAGADLGVDKLGSAITGEAKARNDSQTALALAFNDAIGAEARAREGGDKALTDRVAALEKATSDLAIRLKAVEDAALRMELVSGAVATAGTAVAITFAKPFVIVPVLVAIPGWAGEQMVEATATEITKAGAKIVVKRSRPTLLLTSGPFENAPAATAFSMLAIGR